MGEVARPWTKDLTATGRRTSSGNSSTVCRNLFGNFDHDQNQQFVRDELKLLAERERDKWNFDFTAGKPLDGRYLWSTDDADLAAPDRKNRRLRDNAELPGTSVQDDRNDVTVTEDKKECRQSQITDFLRKRKSTTTTTKKVTTGQTLSENDVKVKRRAST